MLSLSPDMLLVASDQLVYLILIVLYVALLGAGYRSWGVDSGPWCPSDRIPTVAVPPHFHHAAVGAQCPRTCPGDHQLPDTHRLLVRHPHGSILSARKLFTVWNREGSASAHIVLTIKMFSMFLSIWLLHFRLPFPFYLQQYLPHPETHQSTWLRVRLAGTHLPSHLHRQDASTHTTAEGMQVYTVSSTHFPHICGSWILVWWTDVVLKGWPMYAQLLIDLFKYLAPFLRNVELNKPMQILYKVLSHFSVMYLQE